MSELQLVSFVHLSCCLFELNRIKPHVIIQRQPIFYGFISPMQAFSHSVALNPRICSRCANVLAKSFVLDVVMSTDVKHAGFFFVAVPYVP